MKKGRILLMGLLCTIALIAVQCMNDENFEQTPEMILKKGKPVPGEDAGNCLSFPVIWSEGVTKTLREAPEMPITQGEWWYWWGIEGDDPNTTVILSGAPDPDNNDYVDDGVPGQYDETKIPGDGWVKAYLQKDPDNIWQAETATGIYSNVVVNEIDWGDNLESVPWDLRSQIRTEVVLYKNVSSMLGYEMRHVSGWGIEEVHGLAVQGQGDQTGAITYNSTQATVYSTCARLTIQKLLVPRDEIPENSLVWVAENGWIEAEGYSDLITPQFFNKAVSEALEGPGYYNAEINVKGKIIYGYTWNVRNMNEGAGDYRITFSLDATGTGNVLLNTSFQEGITEILIPEEEDVITTTDETEHGGGVAKIDFENNLTYIDITINAKTSGGRR